MVMLMILKYFVVDIVELRRTDKLWINIEVFHKLEQIFKSATLIVFGSIFQVYLILKVYLDY